MFPVGPAGNPVQVDPKVIFDNFRWITSTRNLHGRPKAAGTRVFGLVWLNAAGTVFGLVWLRNAAGTSVFGLVWLRNAGTSLFGLVWLRNAGASMFGLVEKC